jgi:SPP1 gp7 family putative phage head morphogenesis protein
MTSAELLQQQLNATTRKPKGTRLDVSAGIAYNAELQRIVRAVSKDINVNLMPTVRNLAPEYQRDGALVMDSWVDVLTAALRAVRIRWTNPRFQALANQIASRFVMGANNSNRRRTERDMGIDIFSDSTVISEYVQASIADNVRLIQSIPDQYLTQVESIVMTNVRSGGRPSSIAKSLQQQLGVTERRAKMIARDQTAKVNGQLNAKRQQDVGFEYFKWSTSHDERVRDRHEDISEKRTAYGIGVYRWDNPPLSDRGTPIVCGQDFQCRCIAIPVSNEEVDANVKAGRVVKGVKR